VEHRLLEGAASAVTYIVFIVKGKNVALMGNPSEQAHTGSIFAWGGRGC